MTSLHAFNVEAFTLLGIALAITALRSYARLAAVGWRNFWADDYLVVVAMLFFVLEAVLAYCVGNKAQGLANNSMSAEERAALHASDPEYQTRVLGSKIQLAGWSSYILLLWTLKGAMCTFYSRLTRDLDGYRARIRGGFALVGASGVAAALNLGLSCRPLPRMWQIQPEPALVCQPAISPALIWATLALNVSTDLYLVAIPLPMLLCAAVPLRQRAPLMAIFGCGLFVIVAAVLRMTFLALDSENGPQLGGSWAVRETFVASVTTNLPMLFPHLRRLFGPLLARLGMADDSLKRFDGECPLSATPSEARVAKSLGLPRRIYTGTAGKKSWGGSEEHIENGAHGETASQGEQSGGIERRLEVTIVEENALPESCGSSTRGGNYTATWSSSRADGRLPERSEYFGDHIHQSAYGAV